MIKRISLLIVISLTASACANVKTGLVGDKREDLAPFADTTVEFLGSASVDFRENELLYLREYYDENTREVARLKDLLERVDGFRDEVVYYSVELVRVSDSNNSEPDKCNALADAIMGEFREDYLRHTDMSEAEFDAVAVQIRQQETLLDALTILQPLIVKTGDYFENLIREAQDEALVDTLNLFDAAIEEEYGAVLRQLAIVYDRRDELLTGLQKIRAYRSGDANALSGINNSTMISNKSYALPASPSDAQLERVKGYFVAQLQEEEVILGLLERDIEAYIASHAELEVEVAEINDGLNLARRQIVAWIRAHEQFADGVREPGRWFAAALKVAEGLKKVKD